MELLPNEKASLRAEYLQKRNALTTREMENALSGLRKQFDQLPFPPPDSVMLYKAMDTRHEVPVDWLKDLIREKNPEVSFAYPRTTPDGEMYAILDHEETKWGKTAFGVTEPIEGKVVEPPMLEWIIVPLLCFDTKGYRVGYGAGFYDRFLKRIAPHCQTIGISWFPPIEKIEDTHAADVPVRYCLTPESFYAF